MPPGKKTNINVRPVLLAVLLLLMCLSPAVSAHAEAIKENMVKAAFTLNFARFTEWPDEALAGSDKTIELCVVGDQSLDPAFQSINGKTIGKRTLHVRFPAPGDSLEKCHILFIADSAPTSPAKIIAAVKGRPVLTIGDRKGFAEKGGVINFIIKEGKLRFEINRNSARQQGLTLSSRLLRLAILVDGK